MNTNETTTAKRGRPIVALSKRQEVLAARNAKREQGIEIKRGRPVTLLSKRQTVLAARAAKREQGIEVKLEITIDKLSKTEQENLFGYLKSQLYIYIK